MPRQQAPGGPDPTAARPTPAPTRPTLTRRSLLRLTLAAGTAGVAAPVLTGLAGCSTGRQDDDPDPLIALADRARADVALITAAVAARPALGTPLKPLQEARTEHAAALEREIARVDPARASTAPAPAAAPADGADLAAVQAAAQEAAIEAGSLVVAAPAARVGLVAAIAACCATYAELLKGTSA